MDELGQLIMNKVPARSSNDVIAHAVHRLRSRQPITYVAIRVLFFLPVVSHLNVGYVRGLHDIFAIQ